MHQTVALIVITLGEAAAPVHETREYTVPSQHAECVKEILSMNKRVWSHSGNWGQTDIESGNWNNANKKSIQQSRAWLYILCVIDYMKNA